MKKLIKSFARWILKDEIQKLNDDYKTCYKLGKGFAEECESINPTPKIIPDGSTDNTCTLQRSMDLSYFKVSCANSSLEGNVNIPTGSIKTTTPIIMPSGVIFTGNKRDE